MWPASRDIGTCRFYMTAILEIQDGRLLPSCGSGSPSKMKAMVMESTWKKFGAFVRHVPIILLSDLTINGTGYHRNNLDRCTEREMREDAVLYEKGGQTPDSCRKC